MKRYLLAAIMVYVLLILANSRSGCDIASYAHRQRTVFLCDKEPTWGRVP
jgi:hypothetical protein